MMGKFWSVLFVGFACVACSRETQRSSVATASASSAATAPPVDVDASIRAKLDAWNAALARRDAKAASPLYAPTTFYYGKQVGAAERDRLLEGFFAKNADYTQTVRDVHIDHADAGSMVSVRFVKSATTKGKTQDYASYLVFDGAEHIIEESDGVTDENLRKMAARRAAPSAAAPNDCESAVGRVDQWTVKHLHLDDDLFGESYLDDRGRSCTAMHKLVVDDPSTGVGHAPRMGSWCVDTSGAAFATGGWRMTAAADHEQPIDVPADLRAGVKRLCTAGMPTPKP